MARGWESKSIEAQQDEAARVKTTRRALSEEERQREVRRQTLTLTRARASEDLARTTSPKYRALLEQTIAAIDAHLAELDRLR